jgi:hypothetical protein
VVLAVAGGAYWWWQYGIPGLAKPPLIAPVSEHENAERIARRMSLDLAKTPPLADAPPVTDAAAPTGIPTQSVIVSEPPAWATSRVEQPPVVARSEPAAEPAQPANEPERRAVPKPAAKPAAAVEAPVVAKTTAVSPVPAGIDKRMRDQTPRQRAEVEYTRGASALQQGRLAEARSGFEAALQTDPAYHAARQALAGVLLDAGQPAEAMLILQEGLQLAPTQFGFAMMAARLHVDRGEIDAAVQTLARITQGSTPACCNARKNTPRQSACLIVHCVCDPIPVSGCWAWGSRWKRWGVALRRRSRFDGPGPPAI